VRRPIRASGTLALVTIVLALAHFALLLMIVLVYVRLHLLPALNWEPARYLGLRPAAALALAASGVALGVLSAVLAYRAGSPGAPHILRLPAAPRPWARLHYPFDHRDGREMRSGRLDDSLRSGRWARSPGHALQAPWCRQLPIHPLGPWGVPFGKAAGMHRTSPPSATISRPWGSSAFRWTTG
jgi:hypothetical protein